MLTDREREEVDANAKQMIRELNASIRAVDDAEQLRRETAAAVVRKTYGSALGALGSWASGGSSGLTGKTAEHAAAEARAQQTEMHRDSVLWFLRQRLEQCCRTQQDMMETRLTRELEKSRGFLAAPASDFADFAQATRSAGGGASSSSTDAAAAAAYGSGNEGLTEDQVQMFEEGNQDMMKHFESTLAKVQYVTTRTCEKKGNRLSLTLYSKQNGRKITGGNIGAAVLAGQQPGDPVGAH